jgi:acetyl esterase/lipase
MWLSGHGIAGIVLKYRMPDPDAGLFVRNGAVRDMHRAIRLVRHRAREWGIAPERIGVMGFSAGGYLAALSGTLFDEGDPDAEDPVERESCRPGFITPVYPLVSLSLHAPQNPERIEFMLGPGATQAMIEEYSPDEEVKSNTPPAFLVHAYDDRLPAEHSIHFYLALREAKVPAELHVYATGGHGFGIRPRGLPVSSWKERWLQWLGAEGFVGLRGQ